jgi:hypothetical protein
MIIKKINPVPKNRRCLGMLIVHENGLLRCFSQNNLYDDLGFTIRLKCFGEASKKVGMMEGY